jgi:LasA protease
MKIKHWWLVLAWIGLTGLAAIWLGGCAAARAGVQTRTAMAGNLTAEPILITPTPTSPRTSFQPATRVPGAPIYTPTPDPPRPQPTLRSEAETYTVQTNDTLASIARRYSVDINTLMTVNQISDPNFLIAGQELTIPPVEPQAGGSEFKIIPDSELVYSLANAGFDVDGFIQARNGYLANYSETVDGNGMTGAQIVVRVAQEYSVNPRLLLGILEYQSGWVTMSQPPSNYLEYPVGYYNAGYKGLYYQLIWAANELNRGYYLWKVNGLNTYSLADGSLVIAGAMINPGTAGVQYLMSLLSYGRTDWDRAVSSEGVAAVYQQFFGYPFDFTLEPLVPSGLTQPALRLPFETGTVWSFTGGPHGGWGDGSAWAAIDFAPPGESLGCVVSDAWVTAVADGLVVRSAEGVVVQDLDGDGIEQTGWTILYLHVDNSERVNVGEYLHAGERVGHASCEGGVSYATHVHLARRYNGEWIAADGSLPFNLEGWISEGTGVEYDGYLRKGEDVIEAWDAFLPENQIGH